MQSYKKIISLHKIFAGRELELSLRESLQNEYEQYHFDSRKVHFGIF